MNIFTVMISGLFYVVMCAQTLKHCVELIRYRHLQAVMKSGVLKQPNVSTNLQRKVLINFLFFSLLTSQSISWS